MINTRFLWPSPEVDACNILLRQEVYYYSSVLRYKPILLLTASLPDRINRVTHLPRLSPARVTRIKGRFFYCAQFRGPK